MDTDKKIQNNTHGHDDTIDGSSLTTADNEKYDEVIADDLKTDEWTIWEHYENTESQKDNKKLKD